MLHLGALDLKDIHFILPCFLCASHYALSMVSDQLESTFARINYYFKSYRPNETTHLLLSLSFPRLEGRGVRGGFSTMHCPCIVQSRAPQYAWAGLPPVLHNTPLKATLKGQQELEHNQLQSRSACQRRFCARRI